MQFGTGSADSTEGSGAPGGGRRWGRTTIGAAVAVAALLVGSTASAGAGGSSARPVQTTVQSSVTGQVAFSQTAYDSTFTDGRVQISDANLHYVKGGNGPALVLVHGWPETSYEWHKVMPALAKTHTVIAIDLPGLGQSSIPASGFDAATTARRLHEAVTALGYHQVQLMAHDLGALIAYPYAKQYPGDVSRMALLETPLNGFGLEDAAGFSFHFGLNAAPKPVPEKLIDDSDVPTYLGWLFGGAQHPDQIAQSTYFQAYSSGARRSAGYEYYRAFPQNAQYNQANAADKITL
ncbi:MAG: alpha/beta fold hydrolase, partial [Actinobacteria bacterium]|nr:alpha/beta fold hydrolase [Actinomycetota bacterium]